MRFCSFQAPLISRISFPKFFQESCHGGLFSLQLRLLLFLSILSFYCFLFQALGLFFFTLLVYLILTFFLHSSHLRAKQCAVRSSEPVVVWSIGTNRETGKRPQSGSGVELYTNGDVYEGEFHDRKFSGSGVYTYYATGRYEGDWIDEKCDGYGVETWRHRGRYRGQYKLGFWHGFGIYTFYSGEEYTGEWFNGVCHGYGAYTSQDGSKYEGEFKMGVKHGVGHYTFSNGDNYAGEYFGDKMHGFGVYSFKNGHKYEGAWHEGRREGHGKYTFSSGETQSGYWENSFLSLLCKQTDQSKETEPQIGLTKVQNTVKEAQKAAEKAQRKQNIEKKMKICVANATKAANSARIAAVKAIRNQSSTISIPKFW